MSAYGLAGYETEGDRSDIDDLIMGHAQTLFAKKETLDTGDIKRGTLLGKITSGGKVVISTSAAGNGAEVPYGIAAHDADASDGDVEIEVFIQGNFNEYRVILGTGHTADSVREAMRQRGMLLEKPVRRYP